MDADYNLHSIRLVPSDLNRMSRCSCCFEIVFAVQVHCWSPVDTIFSYCEQPCSSFILTELYVLAAISSGHLIKV